MNQKHNHNILTRRKLALRLAGAGLVLLAILFVCSLIGSERISFFKAAGSAFNPSENIDAQIYFQIRLPRLILAAIVGGALACSGVILQALLRNPLADPYILGISSGAGLGAMLSVILGINFTLFGRPSIGVFAFVGAFGTVWLVWAIARLTGRTHATHLLLAGVVVNAFFSALIMFLTAVSNAEEVYSTLFWLMGNIRPEPTGLLVLSAILVLITLVVLYRLAPSLNAISFNPEHARTLGINVGLAQTVAFSCAALVTAVAVSLSGLIGFVGLIVPHGIRLVLGPDHRQLLPVSTLCGAAFLAVSDTIARTSVANQQLPVGVITALIGGPVFLFLLIRYTRRISWLNR